MADKHMKLPLPGFWLEDRGLSFFLAFLVIMTMFVPMVGLSRPGRIAGSWPLLVIDHFGIFGEPELLYFLYSQHPS